MRIKVTHRFTATHQHPVPPKSRPCEAHAHDWVLHVVIEGPLHPTYGWVADFRTVEQLPPAHYDGTCEQFLCSMMADLSYQLGPGPMVTYATLDEIEGERQAVYEPACETLGFGPEVK